MSMLVLKCLSMVLNFYVSVRCSISQRDKYKILMKGKLLLYTQSVKN